MTEEYYPPGGFYFAVTVIGSAMDQGPDIDASCQEVSGIQAEFDVEEVVEGGENRFVHRLPRPAKHPNLVLKRGVVTKYSYLADWAGQTIGANLSLPIEPQNLMVSLLDERGTPTIAWTFVNAYPLKWDVGPLSSMDNQILTETLELSYNYFTRLDLGLL